MLRTVSFVLLLFVAGCQEAPAASATRTTEGSYPCATGVTGPYEIVRVSDGDTIVVRVDKRKPVTVRLIGVDAPEIDGPYRKAEPGGAEARSYVEDFLRGQPVFLGSDPEQGPRDKHGRILAYVYRQKDCVLVNGEIIRSGYGESYRRFRFRHRDDFVRYEQEAKKSRRGLWSK